MKRAPLLALDFASALRPRRRLAEAMLLASTCACVAVLVLWSRESASLGAERLQGQAGSVLTSSMRGDASRRAASVAREKLPSIDARWDDVFAAIESRSSPDATLLAMEPVARTGEIQLTGEARSLDAMLSYVGALQQDRRLRDVTLLTHQVQVETPGAPVRFRVQAHWGARL